MLDPAAKSLKTHFNLSDPIVQTSDKYGVRARQTAQNYANFRSWNHGTEPSFESATKTPDDDSGDSTPPLWRTSPPSSPQRGPNHYRSLSPASRAQAIARGQRELMEMVSRMPENCYELSLKDLVERPMIIHEFKQETQKNMVSARDRKYKKTKSDKKIQMNRSGSVDNGGFLLKMVFPVSLGSKKKNKTRKKSDLGTSVSAKVSPKPPAAEGSAKGGVDKEWWKKKRFTASTESESGGDAGGRSSTNSGSSKSTDSGSRSSSSSSTSSNGNNRRQKSGGCWSFMRTKKDNVAE